MNCSIPIEMQKQAEGYLRVHDSFWTSARVSPEFWAQWLREGEGRRRGPEGWGVCLHPEIAEREIEVFQPRAIHIGHGEVYTFGICPRCWGRSGAELLAGDINRIHRFLAERGIRTAMWGDKLQNIIVGGWEMGGRSIRARGGTWFTGEIE